jgi:hypothetical protein
MIGGNVNGGIYLMHLSAAPDVRNGTLAFTWKSIDGNVHDTTLHFAIPPALPAASISDVSCNLGIRKAVALTEYVRVLSKYSTDLRFAAQGSPSWQQVQHSPRRSSMPADVYHKLHAAGADAILRMSAQELGVRDVQFLLHHEYARLFTDLLAHLRAEMLECGDSSLATSNQNIVETLSRVIHVETSEFMSLLAAAAPRTQQLSQLVVPVTSAPADDHSSSSDDDGDDRNPSADTPSSLICPISHMIFKDPVTAADDNTCVARQLFVLRFNELLL